jgi:hypothetical protein
VGSSTGGFDNIVSCEWFALYAIKTSRGYGITAGTRPATLAGRRVCDVADRIPLTGPMLTSGPGRALSYRADLPKSMGFFEIIAKLLAELFELSASVIFPITESTTASTYVLPFPVLSDTASTNCCFRADLPGLTNRPGTADAPTSFEPIFRWCCFANFCPGGSFQKPLIGEAHAFSRAAQPVRKNRLNSRSAFPAPASISSSSPL